MKRREFVKTVSAARAGLLLRSPFSLHAQQPQPDPAVKRVLVMFKCHFDAGFIDTQANVVHKYFEQYFPQAIEIARAANAQRQAPLCVDHRLLAALRIPGTGLARTSAKRMEEAIARRDIAWHALPFTWQTEMLTPSMIEGSLALSQSLDRRFGVVTTGAKMTDVPGHTRGLIPPLAKHGVNFLDIGVNDGCTAAEVAADLSLEGPFRRDPAGDVSLGYGGIARVPGSDLALADGVRGDNSGPHTAEEIRRYPCRSGRTVSQRGDHRRQSHRTLPMPLSPIATSARGDGGNRRYLDLRLRQRPAEARSLSRSLAPARRHGSARAHFKLGMRPTGAASPPAAGGRAHLGHRYQDLARLRQLQARATWPACSTPRTIKWWSSVGQEKRQDLLDGVATLPAPCASRPSAPSKTRPGGAETRAPMPAAHSCRKDD